MKRTKKELAERLKQAGFSNLGGVNEKERWEIVASAAAAFLGVELAPEPPPLPDWWDEELEVRRDGRLGRYMLDKVMPIGCGSPLPPQLHAEVVANRAALVASHNARLRGLRELINLRALANFSGSRWSSAEKDTLSSALRLLRGEDADG